MKQLSVVVLAFLSLPVFACQPDFSSLSRLKNLVIFEAANKAAADLSVAKIVLANYEHNFGWTFSDSAFECHDSDEISGEVTLSNFPHIGNPSRICESVIRVKMTRVPKKKNQKAKFVTKTEEVSSSCH